MSRLKEIGLKDLLGMVSLIGNKTKSLSSLLCSNVAKRLNPTPESQEETPAKIFHEVFIPGDGSQDTRMVCI